MNVPLHLSKEKQTLSPADFYSNSERLLLSYGLPDNTGEGSAGFELDKEGKEVPSQNTV